MGPGLNKRDCWWFESESSKCTLYTEINLVFWAFFGLIRVCLDLVWSPSFGPKNSNNSKISPLYWDVTLPKSHILDWKHCPYCSALQCMLHLSQHIYKIWVPQIGRDGVSGRRLYSYLLGIESTLCKTPHFQWFYGKLNQIYEKLRSDQMDPKPALEGPKPVSRTGGSLLRNWNYTSN